MTDLGERLDELEARLDMLYDMSDLHCKATNRAAHRLDMLERYTVQQLERACEELERNREAWYDWVAQTHDDLSKFRKELYRRKKAWL